MKYAKWIGVVAIIVTALSGPLRADVIADQSRINISKPQLINSGVIDFTGVQQQTRITTYRSN